MNSITYLFVILNLVQTFQGFKINQLSFSEDPISDTIFEIVSKYSAMMNKPLVVLYGSATDQLYIKLSSLKINLVIMNNDREYDNFFTIPLPDEFTDNYVQTSASIIIFYVEHADTIPEGLFQLTETIFFSSYAKYVLYCKNNFFVPQTFYILWWYFILNAVILNRKSDQIEIIKYNPYIIADNSKENQYGCWSKASPELMLEENMLPHLHCNKSCGGLDFNRFSTEIFVQTCLETYTEFYSNTSIIFDDRTKDLKGFPLTLFAYSFIPYLKIDFSEKGLNKYKEKDGRVLRLLANKMNFTVNLVEHNKKKKNFEIFIGGMFDVSFRKIDFSANQIYYMKFSYPKLEMTYPLEGSGLCFIVHRPKNIPTWVNFSQMFNKNALYLVTGVFHFVVLVYFIHLQMLNEELLNSLFRGYMYAIQLFISAPVHWVGASNDLRIFIFLVFWFVFVLNFMFQGVVVSLLTIPRTEVAIDTFQQLYDSGFSIEGYPSPDIELPEESDLFKGINKRFIANKDMLDCPRSLAKNTHKACWLNCLTAAYLTNRYRDENQDTYIHIGKDRVHSYYIIYYMTKNSPLKQRVDYYLKILFESGILKMWREMNFTTTFEATTNVKVLNLADLQGCFYFLFFGQCFSTIIFLLECEHKYLSVPLYKCCKKHITKLYRKIRRKCFFSINNRNVRNEAIK